MGAYYPVFLRIAGERCVVIGGGTVAERKVEALRAAGGAVTVIAPALTETLAGCAARGEIAHRARPYQDGDLEGAWVAIAATDDEAVQAAVAAEAAARRVPLNVVDRPEHCSFIVPALVRRGDLTVAIATDGGSPALAARVRREIERALGPEYGRALELLAQLRHHLRSRGLPSADRQRILKTLVDSELLDHLRAPDMVAVDRLLAEYVGPDVTVAALCGESGKRSGKGEEQ